MAEWTRDMVEERIAEAAAVLKRLPGPRSQGYFSTWPDILRSREARSREGAEADEAAAAEHRGDHAAWRRRSPGTSTSSATTPA